MSAYRVELSGCDDTTYLDVDLTDEQYRFLVSLEALSHAESSYGCMPTLTVKPARNHQEQS